MDSPIPGTTISTITVRADTQADFERIRQEQLGRHGTDLSQVPMNEGPGAPFYIRWHETPGEDHPGERATVMVLPPHNLGPGAGVAPGGAAAGERARPLT